jgi:D-alanyl-D-alanine carboxypeptidase
VATKTAMSVNELFPIRSVTKSFTVTLILQLARDGELSMNDPISKYVPGIPDGNKITLTDLAAMESGIKSYTDVKAFLGEFVEDFSRQWTPQELVDFGISESPIFKPGEQYDYSNTNTILLGMVVQDVTHLSLAQAYQQFIFNPLGLTQTSYPDDLNIPNPHPIGYQVNPETGALEALPTVNLSGFGAAGGIVSDVNDLLIWGRALGTGSLIGPELQQFRMDHSRPATDGPEYDLYGVGIGEINGWWGHTGEGLGYQAATFYDPSTGTTIVVLVNSTQPVNVATQIFKALANVIDNPGHGKTPSPCAVEPFDSFGGSDGFDKLKDGHAKESVVEQILTRGE